MKNLIIVLSLIVTMLGCAQRPQATTAADCLNQLESPDTLAALGPYEACEFYFCMYRLVDPEHVEELDAGETFCFENDGFYHASSWYSEWYGRDGEALSANNVIEAICDGSHLWVEMPGDELITGRTRIYTSRWHVDHRHSNPQAWTYLCL